MTSTPNKQKTAQNTRRYSCFTLRELHLFLKTVCRMAGVAFLWLRMKISLHRKRTWRMNFLKMSELRVHSLIVLSDHSCLGKKTPFVSPFYTKHDHFTKTGSVHTV